MQKNSPRSQPQLGVIVETMHPRVVYTLETVLNEFLGIRIVILPENKKEDIVALRAQQIPLVGYLRFPEDSELRVFPCNGLLYEDDIRPADRAIHWLVIAETWLLNEDCFGRIFFALSQYALLQPGAAHALDAHGRYPDGDGELVVHEWLARISVALEPFVPRPERHPSSFDYEITIDVDHPWKYLHKPLAVKAGGIVKDTFQGRDVGERLNTLMGGKDPFDVLDTVRAICPPEKTKVFFLVGGNHPNDSRFDISKSAYQNLVQQWKKAGFEIGLHPSYETAMTGKGLVGEMKSLKKVVGEVRISRQHYLRYSLPDTFRRLVEMDIEREYTLCLSGRPGAATGVALPYRWFDLAANKATGMIMVPAMVMDRTLQQYMACSPSDAQATIAAWIAKVRAVSGRFVIILHNETFSESGEWKGWLPVITSTLSLLKT